MEPSILLEPNLRASRISDAFQILRQVKTSMEDERVCDFDHLNQLGGFSWLKKVFILMVILFIG